MYTILYAINILLMIFIPIALGIIVQKRLGSSWSLFGIGGGTFVLSQIVHIPFNAIVLPILTTWSVSLGDEYELIVSSLFIGLSAGIFEESARYLTYRYWVRGRYQWSKGLMLGLGHGGTEAIILGILTGINIGYLTGIKMGYFTTTVPSGTDIQIAQLADGLYSVPIYQTLLGAIERAFAMSLQIALSLTVMQAFVRNNQWWFVLAIGLHSFVDVIVVWSSATFGVEVSEILIAIFAFFGALLIYNLRKANEPIPEQEPLPEINVITGTDIELTSEHIDDSRYI